MGDYRDDWKQQFVNEADEALQHSLVKDVVDEYIRNMQPLADLSAGLPNYGLHKVMHYVAVVARAQAKGFDPDLLRLTPDEANAVILEKARIAAEAGVPVMIVEGQEP